MQCRRPPPHGGLTPYTGAVDYVIALLPSIGVGLLFYIVMRTIVNADRNEREAIRRLDEEEAASRANPNAPEAPAPR